MQAKNLTIRCDHCGRFILSNVNNVVPACEHCNFSKHDKLGWIPKSPQEVI